MGSMSMHASEGRTDYTTQHEYMQKRVGQETKLVGKKQTKSLPPGTITYTIVDGHVSS